MNIKTYMRNHPLTWTLIVINTFIFLLVFSMPSDMEEWLFKTFSFSSGTSHQIWRWFTSLFLHASASHLFFNMLGLYFFGKNLEEETKKQWMFFIYIISGLLGNLAFMFTNTSPVVGSSGAIFGLLGASMLLNPTRTVHLYFFPLPIGLIAVVFIIAESFVAYFQPPAYANIATISHLAGILSGSIFAFFYNPKKAIESFFVLMICFLLLVFLGPIFALITGIGGIMLQIIDSIIGFFLYGIADMFSFLWS